MTKTPYGIEVIEGPQCGAAAVPGEGEATVGV